MGQLSRIACRSERESRNLEVSRGFYVGQAASGLSMDKIRNLVRLGEIPPVQPPARPPSELAIERQKLFAQQEARLWELRKARLSSPNDVRAGPAARTYDVVRYKGAWRVQHLGKHSLPQASQQAAIASAIEKAKSDAALGRVACVRLVRVDGRVWPVDLATGVAVDPSGVPTPAKRG